MYWTLGISAAAALILSLPPANIVVQGIGGTILLHFAIGPIAFVGVLFVLGFFMSLGKAAVYKHIPTYYPNDVGAVGGLVGMIGGLGGFILPIAFGALNDATGIWQSCFMLLFLIAALSLLWMHIAIRRMERADGTYSANCHGHRFFENVVDMVNLYLATKPDPATYEFLSHNLAELTDRFGGVAATTFKAFPSYPQRYTHVLDPQPQAGPVPDCRIEPLKAARLKTEFTERDLTTREFRPAAPRRRARAA